MSNEHSKGILIPEMPSTTEVELTTVVTGNLASKHDGRNLFIFIEIGAGKAVCHSAIVEHAGTHRPRHVVFCADHDCTITFTNPGLFVGVRNPVEVAPTVKLTVAQQADNNETYYTVAAMGVSKLDAEIQPKTQPRIVVP